jgi:spore maturation protein CgeB
LYNEEDKRYREIETLPDYWKGFIHGLVEAQLNVFGYNFIADSLSDDDVAELKKQLKYVLVEDYRNADREVIADMYIGQLCSAMDRKRTMERLTKSHQVTIYTGSDTSKMENVDNRGIADSLTMMPKIFHCSKINLNVTSKTIQTGIPLRVFDVLGCGGFLITNYQAELCEYFEPGVDLVVYEDLADLEQKVDYYLEHEEERKQIADNGYRRVCENYTYDIMLEKILTGVLLS